MRKIMKKKIYALCLCLMATLAVLAGCGKKTQEGNKNAPLTVGEVGHYNGMKSKDEEQRFKADVTLEDTCRGELAMEIFQTATMFEELDEKEVPEDSELLAVKMTIQITDTSKDQVVEMGAFDVDIFRVVSEEGVMYEKFFTRQYIEQNLFQNMYKGGKQTGYLFFVVKKEDANPLLVLSPKTNGGLWFKTTIPEEEKGENLITLDEWDEADKIPGSKTSWEDGFELSVEVPEGNYAGTLEAPLPVGEWGYFQENDYDGGGGVAYELRTQEILRGEAAAEVWEDITDQYERDGVTVKTDQELLLVHMEVNMLESVAETGNWGFNTIDFKLINGKKSVEYDSGRGVDIYSYEPGYIYDGGNADFYVGYIIDKEDDSPVLLYDRFEGRIYFATDPGVTRPEGFDRYESIYADTMSLRDASAPEGSYKNPIKLGKEAEVSYQPREYSITPGFNGKITVLEGYTGAAVSPYLNEYSSESMNGRSLVILKLRVQVDKLQEETPPKFSADAFTFLTEGNAELKANDSYAFYLKDGLEKVYPGNPVEGYIGFYVWDGMDSVSMTYGNDAVYSKAEDLVWFEIPLGELNTELEVKPKEEFEYLGEETIKVSEGNEVEVYIPYGNETVRDEYEISNENHGIMVVASAVEGSFSTEMVSEVVMSNFMQLSGDTVKAGETKISEDGSKAVTSLKFSELGAAYYGLVYVYGDEEIFTVVQMFFSPDSFDEASPVLIEELEQAYKLDIPEFS